MSQHPGPARAVQLNDREVIDDHGLRQARLSAALTGGTDRRRGPARSTVRRLLIGALIAAVALAVIAAVTFVRTQLANQQRLKAGVTATASVTTTASAPAAVRRR